MEQMSVQLMQCEEQFLHLCGNSSASNLIYGNAVVTILARMIIIIKKLLFLR